LAEAEQEYKRALVLDPGSSGRGRGAGEFYMRGRRFPEAEDYLRKLLANDPNSAAVEIQLGRVLAAEGKTDEAIAALAGIKLAPRRRIGATRSCGFVYDCGKNDLAEAAYGC
jgi:predicted Zn-dependent protease